LNVTEDARDCSSLSNHLVFNLFILSLLFEDEVMTALIVVLPLIVVVEISLQLHQSLYPFPSI
jgi:hypothetical protein